MDFDDKGLVCISGENGAGKSSIFNALLWTLFGKTNKKLLADDVIREDQNHEPIKGNTHGYVSLLSGLDDVEVYRHRGHTKHKNKLLLYCNEENLTRGTDDETQDMLNNMLGMDYEAFMAAVVFPQHGEGFVSLTDSQQKAILDKVIDTNRFLRAKEYNKILLDKNKDSLSRCSAMVFELERSLNNYSGDYKNLELQQDRWMLTHANEIQRCKEELKYLNENSPEIPNDLEFKIKQAEVSVRNEHFVQVQQETSDIMQEISDIKSQIAGYEAEKGFLESRVGPRPEKVVEKPEKYTANPELLKAQITVVRSKIDQTEGEITARHKDLVRVLDQVDRFTGFCPLCGTKADQEAEKKLIGDSKSIQAELEQELAGMRENVKKWKKELKSLEKSEKAVAAWLVYVAAVDSYKQIDELIEAIDSLKLVLKEANFEKLELDGKYSKLLAIRTEFDKLVKQKEEIQEDISEHNHKIAMASDRLKGLQGQSSPYTEQLADLKNRRDTAESRLVGLSKLQGVINKQVSAGLYWDRGFSNSGVKCTLLANMFPVLTDRTNQYLRILTDGKATVDFSSQTRIGSGELRERIECKVEMNDGGGSYNKASGGERQRIDLAVMFALGDLAAERTRTAINLRLLDEPFDNLDADGAEKVIEVLEELVVPASGTVLVMSHSEAIKSLVSNRIRVEKHNGVSKLIA